MTRLKPESPGSGLDIDSVQQRLLWANNRDVEERFLDSVTDAMEHTVCWLIERGEVTVEDEQGTIRAKAGQWVMLRASEGRQSFSPRSRLISLRFDLRLRGGGQLFMRRRSRVVASEDFPLLEKTARKLARLLEPHGTTESLLIGRGKIPLAENLRIEAAFCEWLTAYVEMMEATGSSIRNPVACDKRVIRALGLIEGHPMREKFSNRRLAARCGLSSNQFGRLFRRETGMGPFQYYDERRFELARHALRDTAMPAKEIAFELGFSSSPHFSKWFTDREGKGPRAFRRGGSVYG